MTLDSVTLTAAVAAHAAHQPEHPALTTPDRSWSYAEVDRHARELAGALHAAGAGPEDRVAVVGGRSADTVLALLGVLYSGAAYCVVDPSLPSARRRAIVEALRPRAVVTTRAASPATAAETPPGVPVVGPEDVGRCDALDGAVAVEPGALAYVLFTSGSTGEPKGVQIEHHSVLNMVRAAEEIAPSDGRPVGSLIAGPSFDVTVWEIFNTLVVGGTLHVPHDDVVTDAELLWKELCDRKVNHAYLPAGLLPAVVDAAERDGAGVALDRVLVGVEPLPQILLGRLSAAVPGLRLINGYGPTETTVVATLHLFRGVDDPWRRTPIGRALPGTRVHVLDDELKPVPPGEVGELVVTGVNLARGYLGDPELTATRFIRLPGPGGERAYRTGDFGRALPDGVLEFTGRRDGQLKIGGIRVEIGEIEAALGAHPLIRRAAVLVSDSPVGKRLVAAVEAPGADTGAAALTPEAVRSWLADRLPPAVVPTRTIVTAAFPRTANGKVDQRALLATPPDRPAQLGPYEEPTGNVELLLARTWRDVLDIPWIGATDDFFRIGGGSLAALHVASRLRRDGLVITASDIETTRTVRALAARCGRAEPAPAPPGCGRADGARVGRFPASREQEGLWAWREMHPDSAGTTVVHALQLRDELDHPRLRAALERVVTRHEALRTTFDTDGGPLRQQLHPIGRVGLPVRTVRDRAEVDGRIRFWANHRFDVRGRCWDAELLVAPDATVLVLAADHLIFDGWSAELFDADLAAAYESGEPRARPVSGVQPVDAAEAQSALLAGSAGERLRAYWTRALDGFTDQMALPAPLTRKAPRTRTTTTLETRVGPDTVTALRRLAAEEGTSLFLTLVATFKTFLHRRGLGPDNVVSVASSRRDTLGASDALGYFVNLVPLRDRIEETLPLRRYLRDTTRWMSEAFGHGDLPFEEMVRPLASSRQADVAGPARIVVAQEVRATRPPAAGGLVLRRWPTLSMNSLYDLALFVDESEGLTLRWVCDSAQFLERTRERLAGGFAAFLAAAGACPDTPIEALPAMAPDEEEIVLGPVNRRRPDPPPAETLVELFARHVAERPEATAVVERESRVSYAELSRRVDGLAAAVGPERADQSRPVVIALEKSADLVAALVAALRLGSSCLPIAPEHVSTRLADLVSRSGAQVVISRSAILAAADLPEGVHTVLLDGGELPAAHGVPAATIGPDSHAYVLPTSGTTGTPKLVGVPHRAVVRLVHHNATVPLGPEDCTILVANSSFDVAIWEVWGALANGGRLVVPDPAELKDPALLCEAHERHGVTAAFFTVTLFARVVEAGVGRLAGLRHLLVGGEAVPPELFAEAARQVPPHILMNGYGPTENGTYSCCYRLDRDAGELRSVPVGRAIHGSRAYVLDQRLRPLPVGAVGEIVVAGAGLAVGYLNDPDLTAERFPPHPWAPGERVYRTGDHGRVLPDGNLEYLGRQDGQVKIRGFRVELGEVEHAFATHPGVRRVLVHAVESTSGRQLTAAAEATADGAVTEAELRSWISERLPAYMVPARIVVLDALPLTANGKVDRELLAAAERARRTSGPRYAAPSSPLERAVAEVWREVLTVDHLGIDDDFFQLGGDSMAVLAATTRLGQRLNQQVPSHLLFECPTVRSLAVRLAPRRSADDGLQALRRRVSAAQASARRGGKAKPDRDCRP